MSALGMLAVLLVTQTLMPPKPDIIIKTDEGRPKTIIVDKALRCSNTIFRIRADNRTNAIRFWRDAESLRPSKNLSRKLLGMYVEDIRIYRCLSSGDVTSGFDFLLFLYPVRPSSSVTQTQTLARATISSLHKIDISFE